MKFIVVNLVDKLAPEEAEAAKSDESKDGSVKASGDAMMGMLIDSIYSQGWTDQVEDFLGEQ